MENILTCVYLEAVSPDQQELLSYLLLDSQLSQYIRTDACVYKDGRFCRNATIMLSYYFCASIFESIFSSRTSCFLTR